MLARVKDGVRRRLQYSGVRAEPGVVLRELSVNGEWMLLGDLEGSVAVEVVAGEVGHGAYDFSDIPLRPGDTVIDIGAHLGVVSIYLAKRVPGITVLAYEPVPHVYALLLANLRRNRVHNVKPFNLAVTADGTDVDLVTHASNTGGGTAHLSTVELPGHGRVTAHSVTLDQILETHEIERCPLLKIDIEGGEYDVLYNTKLLSRIEHIRGEFHENEHLRSQGYEIAGSRRTATA